jgi:hypothetical protein
MANGGERRLVGAMAEVDNGRVSACTVRLTSNADAWATGSASGWLHAVLAAEVGHLELGGDQHLVRAILEGLHGVLAERAPQP